MSKELEKDIENLKKDMGKFKDGVTNTLSDVGEYAQDKAHQTHESLKEAVKNIESIAAEKLSNANEIIHDQCQLAKEKSRDTVMNHPLTAVAIAFGAGILAGVILRKSRNG